MRSQSPVMNLLVIISILTFFGEKDRKKNCFIHKSSCCLEDWPDSCSLQALLYLLYYLSPLLVLEQGCPTGGPRTWCVTQATPTWAPQRQKKSQYVTWQNWVWHLCTRGKCEEYVCGGGGDSYFHHWLLHQSSYGLGLSKEKLLPNPLLHYAWQKCSNNS